MPSRDDFKFVLLPWENRGATFDPRPDFVTSREADGLKQLFLLKVRANRLFFRLAEDETRVWATLDAIHGDIVPFWNSQLQEGRFARLFVDQVHSESSYHERTEVAALVAADGEAWLCEWCSDQWWQAQIPPIVQKYVRTHHKLNIWHQQWRPYVHRLLSRNRAAIFNRPMPPSERHSTAIRWVSGSEKELIGLLGNLCLLHFDLLTQLTQTGPLAPRWIPNNFSFSLRSDSLQSTASLKFEWTWLDSDPRLDILDVFLAHNYPIGVNWKPRNNREYEGMSRADWTYSSHVNTFGFYRQTPLPAQREQARLALRHWLHVKTPEANIDSWLS